MPTPTSEFNTTPFFWDQKNGPQKLPAQVPPNIAETNASKELGRLAVFVANNFPELVGEGAYPVDIAIQVMTNFKQMREPAQHY